MATASRQRGPVRFVLGLLVVATLVAGCATAPDAASNAAGEDTDPAREVEQGPASVGDTGADHAGGADAAPGEGRPPLGATITVTGTVDEVVDENAFEVVQRGGGPEFLVLVRDAGVALEDVVRVTGTVREQDFDALAAELDFPIDEDLYSPADPQHVLVADTVELMPPEKPSTTHEGRSR